MLAEALIMGPAVMGGMLGALTPAIMVLGMVLGGSEGDTGWNMDELTPQPPEDAAAGTPPGASPVTVFFTCCRSSRNSTMEG
jgi:hypothetical protein